MHPCDWQHVSSPKHSPVSVNSHMCIAGQKFDMDPKTFTLGNMFAMRLHQYGPDIAEITNAAIKELTIETELKKLSDIWKEQHFDLFKYTKGGMDDRGWILKSKPASSAIAPCGTLTACLNAARLISFQAGEFRHPAKHKKQLTRTDNISGAPLRRAHTLSSSDSSRRLTARCVLDMNDSVAAAGIEDVTLLLEDMGLNLQSMMASRFVRPFAEEVRKWEQRLSLVSECIEIWMLVQRKWMYLESIFMDSDDIRHQLPQVQCVCAQLNLRHMCLT